MISSISNLVASAGEVCSLAIADLKPQPKPISRHENLLCVFRPEASVARDEMQLTWHSKRVFAGLLCASVRVRR
jgi:hypothetical protein